MEKVQICQIISSRFARPNYFFIIFLADFTYFEFLFIYFHVFPNNIAFKIFQISAFKLYIFSKCFRHEYTYCTSA